MLSRVCLLYKYSLGNTTEKGFSSNSPDISLAGPDCFESRSTNDHHSVTAVTRSTRKLFVSNSPLHAVLCQLSPENSIQYCEPIHWYLPVVLVYWSAWQLGDFSTLLTRSVVSEFSTLARINFGWNECQRERNPLILCPREFNQDLLAWNN